MFVKEYIWVEIDDEDHKQWILTQSRTWSGLDAQKEQFRLCGEIADILKKAELTNIDLSEWQQTRDNGTPSEKILRDAKLTELQALKNELWIQFRHFQTLLYLLPDGFTHYIYGVPPGGHIWTVSLDMPTETEAKEDVETVNRRNDKRNLIAKKWMATKPDINALTTTEILQKLIEFSSKEEKKLFGAGGENWLNRDHSVIPKRNAGCKPGK